MCRTAALLFALGVMPGCSLAAPSDESLMGELGKPSNVPPQPPLTDGLVFWLDGATGVETVDVDSVYPKISRWSDLSGNGYDAVQSNDDFRPVWIDDNTSKRQLPLFSSGANMTITGVPLAAQGFTLLLLSQPLLFAATDTPVGFGTEAPQLVGEDDLDLSFRTAGVETNDIDIPFGWVPGSTAFTIARVAQDGQGAVRVDGHEVPETKVVMPVSGTFDVAIGNSAARIVIVGLYDRALSVTELSQIEQTAAKRWACCKP